MLSSWLKNNLGAYYASQYTSDEVSDGLEVLGVFNNSSRNLDAIAAILNDIVGLSNYACVTGADENGAGEAGDDSALQPLLRPAQAGQATSCQKASYHLGVFGVAAVSAVDFWFGAEQAIQRYPFSSIAFFQWNAPISSLLTNLFFNQMAYLDYLSDDSELTKVKRAVAVVAAVATIAPYFFIGFTGELWQKIVVVISTIANLPVFYYGALDFYQYFHSEFVQQWRWIIRCSPDKYHLASQKSYLIHQMKDQYKWFSYATKQERTQFIDGFNTCEDEKKLLFLVARDFTLKTESDIRTWAKWLFCSGSGICGLAVMAQNLGHVALTVAGILAMQQIPFWSRLILAVILGVGNFIPSVGFSFATMANFDLKDFFCALLFINVPQVQRVVFGNSIMAMLSLGLMLLIFRYCYITSGFGNDEVNYEGALFLGANEEEAAWAGINANAAGAIVFNGVLCEKLFKTILTWIALEVGDVEDQRQAKFEESYSKMASKFAVLPLQDIRSMQEHADPRFSNIHASFFADEAQSGAPQREAGYKRLGNKF